MEWNTRGLMDFKMFDFDAEDIFRNFLFGGTNNPTNNRV